MYDFDLVIPTTVAEASTAMKADGAQALGGGQTLLPTMKQRLAAPETLVKLSGLSELVSVSTDAGALCVGGATTHGQVAQDGTDYPALAALAGNIGDPAVRNRGTIGGSIANNDPSACYPAGALGSGATIVTNTREIAADDFFVDLFETALEEGEIVTGVNFPIPDAANYQKFDQPASRFALVGVFVAKFGDTVRVAVTGASNGGVFRWSEAEAALSANFAADAIEGLAVDAGDLISDLHGTAEYRAHLISVLTRRAVQSC
ncbi:xanthine dehydrogenase family protein subunit M [Octadecabacter sp. 1_MG-2023]|uniref:FAD binding domain-containing protein n=1 Tax=unclassified Octadecabacter TaxID=196158 RepID=UPI001C09F80E|nr:MULTISPECIES: xanthine dehydrogenase family protein subunit M [unclassified Octadecabacter]MBU2994124.1 xanthine dehydrogenase family protein subunit M [Octadecabacter sp. B2R22]MDO6734587.1 xanthine dehydrogenase family protein subunit M [Octadecabacter sp. 1_MG-2023]